MIISGFVKGHKMISDKMQQAMNDQVTAEYYSAHLYLSMQTYLDSIDLPGFASGLMGYLALFGPGVAAFFLIGMRSGKLGMKELWRSGWHINFEKKWLLPAILRSGYGNGRQDKHHSDEPPNGHLVL